MAYPYTQTNFQPIAYPYYTQNQQANFYPPQVVQPQQTQLVAQNQPQTTNSPIGTNIIWIADEKSAQDYPVAIGNTVILVDYDFKTVYKKATDLTGKPLPIETYDLIPRSGMVVTPETPQFNTENLITKEEFAEFKTKLKQKLEELANDEQEMIVVPKKRGKKQRVEAEIVDANGEGIKDESSDEL